MIKGTEDTRYAYVNGIVRARESRLLTKSHFDRLIAGTIESFTTILSDTAYGQQKDIPKGFEMEIIDVNNFFRKYCLTPETQLFIDWPEQIHNLKVKLKEGSEDIMYAQASSDVETWPEVSDAVEQYAVEKDPFILSSNLDKILCKYLSETSHFAPFFEKYYQLSFDLENIRSFFRARHFENSREIFVQVYIPYGSIDMRLFLDNLSSQHDALARSFFITPYMRIVDKGSSYIDEHHSFLILERLIEEMRLEFLLSARKMTFGIEPLFSYYHFRMSEIKKLRQVYWGKLNEVPIDELKESIPDVW